MRADRRRFRMIWLLGGGLFAALTVLAVAVSLLSWLARQSVTQDVTYRHPISGVRVELDSGNAVVVAGRPGQIVIERRLTWSYQRPKIEERWAGDTLIIRVRCTATLQLPGCSVSYKLQVPPDATVTVHTSSGNIRVQGMKGDQELSSHSGGVDVVGSVGALVATVHSGAVRGSQLRSPWVSVDSDSGSVDLLFAAVPAAIRVVVASGDVRVAVPDHTYNVTASGGGKPPVVAVRQSPAATPTIQAQASSGSIWIGYVPS